MTVDEYRRIALAQPKAVENSHMNHPDFRVGKKIFATIRSLADGEGVLMLTPEQQKELVNESPKIFGAVAGGWGVKGATTVNLATANAKAVNRAMRTAWRNKAPKRLIARIDGEL